MSYDYGPYDVDTVLHSLQLLKHQAAAPLALLSPSAVLSMPAPSGKKGKHSSDASIHFPVSRPHTLRLLRWRSE